MTRIWKYRFYYYLAIPGLLYFLIFHYVPMGGALIAFKDISPFDGLGGFFDAPWVGLKHFERFTSSVYFYNIIENTIIISGLKILFGFPAPIIFALLLNEILRTNFKRIIQTISYLPHFISWVVTAGMITALLATSGGLLTESINSITGSNINFLGNKDYFVGILVTSHVWKTIGWSSIIYLAAMSSIDPALYESARMDGANRLQMAWYITIPSISLVIVIMFLLEIGNLLEAGFEQIVLLYSPSVYKVADIIDTFVYREGLLALKYSFASAVGLFKAVIAFFLLYLANKMANRLGHTGLW